MADVDPVPSSKKSSKSGVERMLEFGRELFQLSQRLEIEQGTNETNQKMLEVRNTKMRLGGENKFMRYVFLFFLVNRTPSVYWPTRIRGPVRSAGSCALRVAKPSALP